MNIFVLDEKIERCAEYHCDQHVVKMLLESAQILCSAAFIHGIAAPYKPTHLKHPCVLWAAESLSNFRWLSELGLALEAEYKFRFGQERDHRSAGVIREVMSAEFFDLGRTGFAQAMPEKYRIEGDPVSAYRNYYIAEKSHFGKWTRREIPEWFRM